MASISVKQIFTKATILGAGTDRLSLSESQIFCLLQISIHDLGWKHDEIGLPTNASIPDTDYYKIPLDWFESFNEVPSMKELQESFQLALNKDDDFRLYFSNLCSLHKRRIKYQIILRTQPKPTMDQIGPRGLLEYGINNKTLLYNWITWRKWIFDIDNRSGQETGYLFEPILASCLGGEPIGSAKSPVKRINSDGTPSDGARQIDCYVADDNSAYEFKLRVTIAASGQGRFAEELSFAKECRAAGLKPILLVLDPTPSSRLAELKKAFIDSQGEVYIGNEAWGHIEDRAGKLITVFIEKYLRAPLLDISTSEPTYPSEINLAWTNESITISDGASEYKIKRS